MNQKEVVLAYHTQNKDVADRLSQHLSGSGYHFIHAHAAGNNPGESIYDQISNNQSPVLLLISDNFLKSANCLENILELVNQSPFPIYFVFTNGKNTDPETGIIESVPTVIDRISDMIRYITYWHDQTLEIRNHRNALSPGEADAFQAHFLRTREVANAIGELLRIMRNKSVIQLPDFAEHSFQAFFEFVEDRDAWELFQSTAPGEFVIPDPEFIEDEVASEEEASETTIVQEFETPEISADSESEQEIPEASAPIPAQEEPVFETEQDESIEEMPGEAEPWTETEPEEIVPEANSEELIKQGLQAYEEGDVAEGISIIGKVVDKNPDDYDLRYHYALMLAHNDRDTEGAIHQLREIIKLNPQHEEAFLLLGKLSEQREDYKEAKSYYQQVLQLNPRHPDVHFRLASVMLHHFDDQKELAVDHLLEGADQHAENPEKLFRYARLLAHTDGFSQNAERLFRQVIEMQPDHAPSYMELARIYHLEGKQEAAHKAYQQAVELKSSLASPELDRQFALPSPEPKAPIPTQTKINTMELSEQATINALIDNINQLQALLSEKQKQAASKEENHAKTVLITGASSGIGRATATVFAAQGYRLILNGRRLDRLETLKSELETAHQADIMLMPFDITSYEAVENAWNALPEEWRSVDVLINNAGKAKGLAPIHEGELRHWEEMIDTNLKGLLYVTRLVTPQMVQRKTGHIVNLSSTAGKDAYPNGNVYCATKFAVEALTKTMRMDLTKFGIRVSQVAPGHVEETEFALVRFDGDAERAKIYEDFKPLTSKDVAEAILFMVNRPPHVNIQDILMMGQQQASASTIERSGR